MINRLAQEITGSSGDFSFLPTLIITTMTNGAIQFLFTFWKSGDLTYEGRRDGFMLHQRQIEFVTVQMSFELVLLLARHS